MSRIFITGDCHADISRFGDVWQNVVHPTEEDYVIILGDFGLVWADREDLYEQIHLDWLQAQPWTTIVIGGNHENYAALERNYPIEKVTIGKGEVRCRRVRPKILFMERGEIFYINNKSFFCFGGADSTDKEYRIINESWWERERPSEEEFEYAKAKLDWNNGEVDYILSHEGPTCVQRWLYHSVVTNPTADMLYEFYHTVKYGDWYFGHHHKNIDLPDNLHILYENIIEL